MREWDVEKAGFWDTAIAGSSALMAALRRRLADEVSVELGQPAATLFWDIQKFYDSVVPHKLIEQASGLQYPPLLLYLGLVVHAAPRFIRASTGCVSLGCVPDTSIIAGDMQSNSWARSLVHDLPQTAHDNVGPPLLINQFVDDLSQRSHAAADYKLALDMSRTASTLKRGLEALDLTVSVSKMGLTASSAPVGDKVAKGLRAVGITVKTGSWHRDLGTAAVTGARRRVPMTSIRRAKMNRRTAQAVKLHRWTKKGAARLYKGGLYPVDTFGVEATGVSPSTMSALRAAAGKLSPFTASGTCVTTSIALSHGPEWDPAVRIPRQIAVFWLDLWRTTYSREALHTRIAWDRVYRRFQATLPQNRWRITKGPISTAIGTLMDLHWDPVRPDLWKGPEGAVWKVIDDVDSTDIGDSVSAAAQRATWARAARHFCGGGLEQGADLRPVKLFIASLKRWKRPADANLMGRITAGGSWPLMRVHDAYPHVDPICTRCGVEPDTPYHRHYGCPCNIPASPKLAADFDTLKCEALEGHHSWPCLWFRAINPAAFTSIDEPYDDSPMQVKGLWTFSPAARIYTDGSGGIHSSDPRLRRCGLSAVLYDGEDRGSLRGPLYGTRQTTPRAELTAVVEVVERYAGAILQFQTPIITDCMYVVRGILERFHVAGTRQPPRSTNKDLWARLTSAAHTRDGNLNLSTLIVKVASHLADVHVQRGLITQFDLEGNAIADDLAGKAAVQAQVSPDAAAAVKEADSRAKRIAKHLLRTTRLALDHANEQPADNEHRKPIPAPRPPKPNYPHGPLAFTPRKIKCMTCWSTCPLDFPGDINAACPCLPPSQPAPLVSATDDLPDDPDIGDPLGLGGNLTDSDAHLSDIPAEPFDLDAEADRLSLDDPDLDVELDQLSLDSSPGRHSTPNGPAPPSTIPDHDYIPDIPANHEGPCWQPGCACTVVEPCEFFACPRWACVLHGSPYIRTKAPFLSLYLCAPCLRGVEQGTICPDRASEPAAPPLQPAASSDDPAPHSTPDPVFAAPFGAHQQHPLAHIPFHPSHALGYKGGYGCCWKCGTWTSGARAQRLTAPCRLTPASAAGQDVRDRVRRGLTPQRGQAWLVPEAVGPPAGMLITAPPPLSPNRRARRPTYTQRKRHRTL